MPQVLLIYFHNFGSQRSRRRQNRQQDHHEELNELDQDLVDIEVAQDCFEKGRNLYTLREALLGKLLHGSQTLLELTEQQALYLRVAGVLLVFAQSREKEPAFL